MACFSARVRVYKALLGLDFFDGRWDVFYRLGERGGGGGFVGWVRLKSPSLASQRLQWDRGVFAVGALPQEQFLAANKILLTKLLSVRATVAHDMVIKNMALAVRIFIFHLDRYNFAYFWDVTHGHDFGDVQVGAVSVVLNDRCVPASYVSRGFVGQGGGGAQAAEGHNY